MFDSLRSFSDTDIITRTKAASIQDRSGALSFVRYLLEFERRGLHLKLGYGSLFDYCTSGLGYSEGAAMRRITAARCVARFPQVHALLELHRVNLSTVSQVSRILTPANCEEVLKRICGRSQRDVQALMAEFEPRAALPPDRVRTVIVRAASTTMDPTACANARVVEPAAVVTVLDTNHRRSDGKKSSIASAPQESRDCTETEPLTLASAQFERRALIQFSAGEEFMAMVARVRSLASHQLPANATLEQVFGLAMTDYIARKDPAARHERREARRPTDQIAKAASATKTARAVKGAARKEGVNELENSSRRVPARVREEVFVRDKSQCTYVGPGGKRCGSTQALQVDHIVPVARGGPDTLDNLRLLCAQHNRFEAERLMGRSRSPASSGSTQTPGCATRSK